MGTTSERVVVITGASSGIGRETACLFAAQGAAGVLAARGEAALHATAEQVTQAGGTALVVPTDVAVWPHQQTLLGRIGRTGWHRGQHNAATGRGHPGHRRARHSHLQPRRRVGHQRGGDVGDRTLLLRPLQRCRVLVHRQERHRNRSEGTEQAERGRQDPRLPQWSRQRRLGRDLWSAISDVTTPQPR